MSWPHSMCYSHFVMGSKAVKGGSFYGVTLTYKDSTHFLIWPSKLAEQNSKMCRMYISQRDAIERKPFSIITPLWTQLPKWGVHITWGLVTYAKNLQKGNVLFPIVSKCIQNEFKSCTFRQNGAYFSHFLLFTRILFFLRFYAIFFSPNKIVRKM